MKKPVITSLLIGSILGVVLYAQTRGTPGQLRVQIDATGALVTAAASQVLPLTSCTFSNCRLLLDAQGRLVTIASGAIPEPSFELPVTFEGMFGDIIFEQEDTASGAGSSPHRFELLATLSSASGNVFAVRNDSATGYSAYSARSDANNERAVFGWANSNVASNPFNLGAYIETQPGTADAAAALTPFRILQDGNFGSSGSGYRFYRRTIWEGDGDISTWRLIPFADGTEQIQTSIMKNDGTGFGLGAGATTPVSQLHISDDTANNPLITVDNYGGVPQFIGRNAAGTLAAPTATTSGTTIARVGGRPRLDNATFKTTDTVAINLISTEAQTTTANGSRIDFRTTVPTTTTIVTTGRMSPAGYEAAGNTPTVANVGANSCGTTTATITGQNNAGRVTVGATSGTQCRITTTAAATNAWDGACSNTTTVANVCQVIGVTNSTFDIRGVFVAGDVISYIAFGR